MCDVPHPGGVDACPERRTGEVIAGKYVVGPLLGCGGMAAVYAAHHRVLRRDVALKVIHRRFAGDAELSARFVREARETAALGHPAFVAVYDAGTTEDGCAFIEMDRLEGHDLYTLRKAEGSLAPERAIKLVGAVLGGLEVLHARGVVHRDIKSSNIYVTTTPDGGEQVKLLDLGFAKVDDGIKLTTRNQLLGTPFYISPEQAIDPTAVDLRSDLYSVGVVLFELLTGKWPYDFTSKRELLGKVMKGDLERHPARLRPDLPGWLDLAVAKALAHDRTQRFASATEMREALERPGRTREPTKSGLWRRILGRGDES
jgi:serine/threonine-protein kinase